ncbi:hypothetical protein B566_EDAN010513 [Ephemera danica]|nr:hypothetical protein B566_EDAN010513 [Ephemera danica]
MLSCSTKALRECVSTRTTRARDRPSTSKDDSLQYSMISSSSVSSSHGRGANEASSPMSYQRLLAASTEQLELVDYDHSPSEDRVVPDKGPKTRVLVERHLRASDLCHVLALKFSVASSGTGWSIVEHWSDLGIERHLEDHEKVLAVYRRSGRIAERIFIFRKDPNKYAFIENPKPYFLSEMERLAGMSGAKSTPGLVLSAVWLRERDPRQGIPWVKAFLLLCEDKLYVCHNTLVRFVREWQCWDANKDNARSASKEDCTGAEAFEATDLVPLLAGSEVKKYASLEEHDVYKTLNARNQLRAPTEFGLCLRATSPLLPVRRVCTAMDFLCFAVESERTRLCWLTAIRMLKPLVRDGYYNYDHHGSNEELAKKLWWDVPSTSKQDNSAAAELVSENDRARVAMDFTGSVGRIVDDPREAREAREVSREGSLCWLQRWRPTAPMCVEVGGAQQPPEPPERIVQMPWYVGQASRERALQLLMQPHLQPGAFLVRESAKAMGMPVLSLRTPQDSVMHIQIQRTQDAERGLIWSLDGGHTKFFSLDHLVEFYELNQGNLPTSLSHFPDLS